jgi:pimeloyl-ACP methyl ester carboxylesterase
MDSGLHAIDVSGDEGERMNTNPTQQTVDLAEGEIRYHDEGSGPPIVFVHGLLVDGTLWRELTPLLAEGHRCIVPDLPLGSHRLPMRSDADLSPTGLARIVDDFMAALDLDGVTLVGNDTGGAISQLVAVNHPHRLRRLVLTPCDSYKDFFPPAFRPLQVAARIPGAITAMLQPMRMRAARSTPLAYGMLTKRRLPDDLLARWVEPPLHDPAVRRDLVAVLRGISNRYTLDAAERLTRFDKPVLIAWAPEDAFFKLANARRLAAAIPDARLELIEDSRTFVPLDQPRALADLVAAFAAGDGAATDSPST